MVNYINEVWWNLDTKWTLWKSAEVRMTLLVDLMKCGFGQQLQTSGKHARKVCESHRALKCRHLDSAQVPWAGIDIYVLNLTTTLKLFECLQIPWWISSVILISKLISYYPQAWRFCLFWNSWTLNILPNLFSHRPVFFKDMSLLHIEASHNSPISTMHTEGERLWKGQNSRNTCHKKN